MAMNPALLSSNLEHYLTPPSFLDLVVEVMGGIDLDPATNRASQVPAARHCYGGEEDGLLMPWTGRTWINPPYGLKIPMWCARMHHVARMIKSIEQMICLLPARMDTEWCQRHVLESADAWLLWSGRITFWRVWNTSELVKLVGLEPPAPFRQLEDGTWVGPDLDKNGRPSPAPFPSLVPYWGPDPVAFGRVFRPHGTLVIARGPKKGVYRKRAA